MQETQPARELGALLEHTVSRLMMGEGPSGTSKIRFALKGEALAGVWVTMHEAEGRIHVEMRGGTEAARAQLEAMARREIDSLARRCKRDLLIRVGAEEDPEGADADLSVIEVLGLA